jgi:hypothetical protein
VYTFARKATLIKIQVVGLAAETIVVGAVKAEETIEEVGGMKIRVLALKNDKNEIVGKFNLQHVAGWWLAA